MSECPRDFDELLEYLKSGLAIFITILDANVDELRRASNDDDVEADVVAHNFALFHSSTLDIEDLLREIGRTAVHSHADLLRRDSGKQGHLFLTRPADDDPR